MLKIKIRIILVLISASVVLILLFNFLIVRFLVWDVDVLGLQINPEATPSFFCGVVDYTKVFKDDSIIDNSFTLNQTGEKLYKENCMACHSVNEVVVGPALAHVSERRKKEWLYSFINNPLKMIKSGDPIALELHNEFGNFVMPSFKNLSTQQIDSILQYIDQYASLTIKSKTIVQE